MRSAFGSALLGSGIGCVLLLVVFFGLKETNKFRSDKVDLSALLRGSGEMLREPQFLGNVLTLGFAFAINFGFLAGVPFILQEKLGFSPQDAAALNPGLIYVSLSAYGRSGPWASRRGFDSLVQCATGFNHAEGQAAGVSGPKELPMQILDHATGYLMAFGAMIAKARQAREGGSWHVQVSLARTGNWLWQMGRQGDGLAAPEIGQDAAQLVGCTLALRDIFDDPDRSLRCGICVDRLRDDARKEAAAVLAAHLLQNDRTPGRFALIGGHIIFPRPATQPQFLDEVHFGE